MQSELSLWTRDRLDDVLPWCRDHDVAFVAFALLGRGFLTGAITDAAFEPGDFRATNPRFTEDAMRRNAAIVDEVGRSPTGWAPRVGAGGPRVLAQAEQVVRSRGRRSRTASRNAAAAHVTPTSRRWRASTPCPPPTGARY
ncbi:MAG: hypothetical protein U0S48_20200 [Solirubrobacteraceae bacterium]